MNSPVLSRPFEGDHARGHVVDRAETETLGNVVHFVDRLSDGTAQNLLLDCYRQGWAEANLAKILAATTPAIVSTIHLLEVFRGGHCMSISIACRTDSHAQE